MTGRLCLSMILSAFLSGSMFSQTAVVTVYGTNSAYEGSELEFFYYTERIFDSYEVLAKTKVDENGAFSVSFNLDKTQCVYCRTSFYLAFIYTEPGKTYNVELPPKPQDQSEKNISPFFVPPSWHMNPVTNSKPDQTELNSLISTFNAQFEPFLDKQILRYYNPKQSREKLDSFILANKINTPHNNEFFETYRFYKIALLNFSVTRFSHNELYEVYLKDKPARPNLPSWWEFFNLYYDRYFSSLTQKPQFSNLYSLIGKGDYFSVNKLLKSDPALQNDRIREWTILKEIHNGFYENNLPVGTLNEICDSLAANTKDKTSKTIAGVVKKEASSLLPGTLPPNSVLLDIEGNNLNINTLTGKYNYIGFCSLENLESLKEFEYLKYFYHKYSKYLDLVILLPETDKDRITGFTDENSIPWKFWYYPDTSRILKDYKVNVFPVFYLLDKEGKIVMSPATSPSEGFEQHLFNILKSKGDI